MLIDLKVSRQPGGRLTLKRKDGGARSHRDCEGPLRANGDAGAFYRAVAHLLHVLHREGHNVSYADTPASEGAASHMPHSPEALAALPVGSAVQLCPTNTSMSQPRNGVVVRHTPTLIFVKTEDSISEEAFRLSDGLHNAAYLRKQFPCWQVRVLSEAR